MLGFHVVKRKNMDWWKAWLIRIASIILGAAVCAVVIVLVTGKDPLNVFETMVDGAFGTERRIWALLQGIAMLLCISLAVTPAFKMKFWNIGAEGQALMGGLASAACMMFIKDALPSWLLILVMLVASMIAGAIWGIIPAVFKARWGTNETLFTLMMNYIAMQIVSVFISIFATGGSGKIDVLNATTKNGWMPSVGGQAYFLNVLIVLVLTIVMYIYLKYSKQGYEISVVGESENTAKYIGINVKKVIIRTMLISGLLCGLAGFLLVSGADHTIARETIGGRGFTAIMVSWLAKFNPIFMVLTSFLLVFFERGAIQISQICGLNASFSDIIVGIIIFFIIGSEFFINYEIKKNVKEVDAK